MSEKDIRRSMLQKRTYKKIDSFDAMREKHDEKEAGRCADGRSEIRRCRRAKYILQGDGRSYTSAVAVKPAYRQAPTSKPPDHTAGVVPLQNIEIKTGRRVERIKQLLGAEVRRVSRRKVL